MKETSDSGFKAIISAAGAIEKPSDRVRKRIFSRIDELGIKRTRGVNPLLLLVYTPSLRVILALVVALPVLAYTAVQFGVPWTVTRYPLTLVSQDGLFDEHGKKRSRGERLAQSDRIEAGADRPCDISIKDTGAIRIFPSSKARLAEYSELSGKISIELQAGTIYINEEKRLEAGKDVSVIIDRYELILAGTAVLFSKEDESATVACFEGEIRVMSGSGTGMKVMESVLPGNTLELDLSETEEKHTASLRSITDEETRIEEEARKDLISIGVMRSEARIEEKESGKSEPNASQTQAAAGTQASRETGAAYEKSGRDLFGRPFEIARIGDPDPSGKPRFYMPLVSGGYLYILSEERLFRIRGKSVDEPVALPGKHSFTAKPVDAGAYLVLVETKKIRMIEKSSLREVKEITLGSEEAIEDNYSPVLTGGKVIFPIKNRGYCHIDLADRELSLGEYYKEEFPLTPLPLSGGIVIGSFYEHYIAYSIRGEEAWRLAFGGSAFGNLVSINDDIYSYLFENGSPKIVEIDLRGVRKREWILADTLVSDLSVSGRTLVGVYENGDVFALDTRSGVQWIAFTAFSGTLSARALRYISPLVSGKRIYLGNDSGSLFIYDLEERRMIQTISIDSGKSILSEPALSGDSLYFVSGGVLFSCAKS